MLLQDEYKNLSSLQLVAELSKIAKYPHAYDNRVARKTSIAEELAARVQAPTVLTSIIVLETD